MNTHPDMKSEDRLATGIKTAALVALVGLVAVLAQPGRMSDEVFAARPVATQAEPAAAGDTQYFPAQFPAPTAVAEPAPTF